MSITREKLFIGSIALSVLAFYSQTVTFGFLDLDDYAHIVKNPYLSLENFGYFWTHGYESLYIPLSYTLWTLVAGISETFLGRLAPEFFHLFNILLHAANAVLVFLFLGRVTQREWPRWAGALLFAFHPLQVETISWAACLRDLLSAFLSLGALLSFLNFWEEKNRKVYWRALLLLVLATLAKPNAISVPFLAGVVAVGILRQPPRRLFWDLSPAFIVVFLITLGATLLQSSEEQTFQTPLLQRHLVAGDALFFYLQKLILPFGLAPLYGRSAAFVLGSWQSYFVWLVPVFLFVALLHAPNRNFWMTASFFFLASLLPVLGFVPFLHQQYSTVTNHYAYLAVIALSIVITFLLDRYSEKAVVLAVTVVLVLFAGRSWANFDCWKNSEAMYRCSLAVNPNNFLASNNLGTYLVSQGQYEEGVKYYQQALRGSQISALKTKSTTENLVKTLIHLRRYDEANSFIAVKGVEPTDRERLTALGRYALDQGMALEAKEIFASLSGR